MIYASTARLSCSRSRRKLEIGKIYQKNVSLKVSAGVFLRFYVR